MTQSSDPIVEAVARAISLRKCGTESFWEYELKEAEFVIRAHLAALEAGGMVVVPREATEAMLNAATVDDPDAIHGLATRYAVMVQSHQFVGPDNMV